MATLTHDQIVALGNIDPEFEAVRRSHSVRCLAHHQQLLQSLPSSPPTDWSDLSPHRAATLSGILSALAALPPVKPTISESYISIPTRSTHTLRSKLVAPKSPPAAGSPLVVLFFGGAFVMGSLESLTKLARCLAHVFGATVLLPDYRLAPEHPFPAAPDDAWDAVRWAAGNAAGLRADPAAGFVVGGVSAGGNLASVVVARAADEPLEYPITAQWLNVPVLVEERNVPEEYKADYISIEQNKKVFGLDEHAMKAVSEAYLCDYTSVKWSPFNRPKGLGGLPKAFLQVCGMDPFRDDGILFERGLREKGVETRMEVYPGLIHASWQFFPMLKTSKKPWIDMVTGMGWCLGMEADEEKVWEMMNSSPLHQA